MSAIQMLSILAATASLAGGYALSGRWVAAGLSLLPAALWVYSQRKALEWPASVGLVAALGLAATGVWTGQTAALMVAGAAAALVAWDWSVFSISFSAEEPDRRQRETQHLRHLLPAAGIGLALAEAGLMIHLQIAFGWLVLITVVILGGLTGVQRLVRRE